MGFNFYVYAYLRTSSSHTGVSGSPYYIGKGQGCRAFDDHKHIPVPKDTANIVIVETNLSELGAFAIERRMIRWYGRKDTKTGILLNMTDGGDGTAGAVHSDKTRKLRSESLKGRRGSMIGKTHSDRTKQKMSDAKKGKAATSSGKLGYVMPQHEKDKISAAQKGIPKPKFKCPHCDTEASIARLSQWHLDNCKNIKLINSKN